MATYIDIASAAAADLRRFVTDRSSAAAAAAASSSSSSTNIFGGPTLRGLGENIVQFARTLEEHRAAMRAASVARDSMADMNILIPDLVNIVTGYAYEPMVPWTQEEFQYRFYQAISWNGTIYNSYRLIVFPYIQRIYAQAVADGVVTPKRKKKGEKRRKQSDDNETATKKSNIQQK